jgi:hypothetical protein
VTDLNEDMFDLDAVAAEQKAKRQPFPFKFRGQRRELANIYAVIDLDTIEAAQNNDLSALRKALTDGLGEHAGEVNVGAMTVDELVPLFERWMESSGATPGESPASSTSSVSTERPSKRTSKGSTGSGSARRSGAARKTAAPPASS